MRNKEPMGFKEPAKNSDGQNRPTERPLILSCQRRTFMLIFLKQATHLVSDTLLSEGGVGLLVGLPLVLYFFATGAFQPF